MFEVLQILFAKMAETTFYTIYIIPSTATTVANQTVTLSSSASCERVCACECGPYVEVVDRVHGATMQKDV